MHVVISIKMLLNTFKLILSDSLIIPLSVIIILLNDDDHQGPNPSHDDHLEVHIVGSPALLPMNIWATGSLSRALQGDFQFQQKSENSHKRMLEIHVKKIGNAIKCHNSLWCDLKIFMKSQKSPSQPFLCICIFFVIVKCLRGPS